MKEHIHTFSLNIKSDKMMCLNLVELQITQSALENSLASAHETGSFC